MADIALTSIQQTAQSLKIQTPLGDDVLVIREFTGTEQISRPFEFSAFSVSTSPSISFDDLLGQAVTVSFDTGDGIRYFNGIVGEIWQRETARVDDDNITVYEVRFYPRLWLLQFVSDCRIFQNMPAIEIIQQILQENGVNSIENLVSNAGQQNREYCVQYNESCLDFISRLMEEEGIFYYFTHDEDSHTMVLGDNPSSSKSTPVNDEAPFFAGMDSNHPENIIYECKSIQKVTVSGHASADYNFTTATTPLYAKIQGAGVGGILYKYPGCHDHEGKPSQSETESASKLALDRDTALKETLEGKSTHPFLTSGHQFQLSGYDRPGTDGPWTLLCVRHHCTSNTISASSGDLQDIYRNTFTAFRADTTYRPPCITPKPRIHSTQTARVTGKDGEEIWTDEYGRIKVKFHWDESGDNAGPVDDGSSCWIRVCEGWAGAGWGVVFTPRIGMEVLVTFLDGDPDRPLVTGCAWNSVNKPPYLPDTPTKSTIRSHSTKDAGDDEYNEFRYEDLRGSEQVYLRAQKDFDKFVGENFTEHIQNGSQWTWIDKGDLDVSILAQDGAASKTTPKGQDLPAGQGDYNLEITGGSWNIDQLASKGKVSFNHYMVSGDHNTQIDEGDVFEYQKSGNYFQQLDQGNHESLISNGHHCLKIQTGDKRTSIDTGDESTHVSEGNQSILLDKGNQYINLSMGNRIKVIGEGSDYEVISEGSKYSTIREGNNVWKIYQGNQQIILDEGNREKSLMNGNETNYINGEFDETVTKNYKLVVVENLVIQVQGNIEIQSEGNITFTSGQNIAFTAAEEISMEAGAGLNLSSGDNMSLNAAVEMTMESGTAITMNASTDINLASGGSVSVEGGVDINLAAGAEAAIEGGASTTIEGGGSTEIIGATVMLMA